MRFASSSTPTRANCSCTATGSSGPPQDAEDALQETLLAAWRGLAGFEGRSSVRTWLYRVATNTCLKALRSASRRPPVNRPPPGGVPQPSRVGEVIWLQPYPDVLLEGLADATPGPEARYEASEAISLAFVTALQALPPRQRAVLILRDVLGFPTSQVAGILDSSEDSAASALKRARAACATSSRPRPPGRPRARTPPGNGTWSTGSPAPTRPATSPASSPC